MLILWYPQLANGSVDCYPHAFLQNFNIIELKRRIFMQNFNIIELKRRDLAT